MGENEGDYFPTEGNENIPDYQMEEFSEEETQPQECLLAPEEQPADPSPYQNF